MLKNVGFYVGLRVVMSGEQAHSDEDGRWRTNSSTTLAARLEMDMHRLPGVDPFFSDRPVPPEDEEVSLYVVERDVPGITMLQLSALQQAAAEMCERFAAHGERVRYLRGTYIPGESRCLCLFEATGPDLVREVNDVAQLPYCWVHDAAEIESRITPIRSKPMGRQRGDVAALEHTGA
ncbi:MAG: hypothetical protein NVSMB22_25760 [Chloroflexota bacterium]